MSKPYPQPIRKHNPFLTLFKLLVTALVIGWVVRKLGWETIVSTFRQVDPLYAFYGLVACVVSIVLGAMQWHLLLHRKELKISFRETFELYYIGMFFSNIGMLAGDTLKVAYIKRRHDFGKLGFAATFLDRFAGLLALSGCAAAACIYLIWTGEFHTPAVKNIVFFTAGLLLLFTVMLAFLMARRFRRVVISLVNILPIPKKEFISALIHATGLDYRHIPFMIGLSFLALLIQLLRISTHIFVAASLGILTADNIVFFFIFIPLMSLVMIVPLPFGVRETVGGSLFALSGIPVNAAFVMQFMATIIGFIGSLWGGIEFMIDVPRGVHQKPAL